MTCLIFVCLFVCLLQQLELITPFQLYFNPDLILKKYQVSTLISLKCCIYHNHFINPIHSFILMYIYVSSLRLCRYGDWSQTSCFLDLLDSASCSIWFFCILFSLLAVCEMLRKCAHKNTFTEFHSVFALHNSHFARMQLCCRSSEFMPLTEQISLLSNAGGRLFPWSNGRFCLYVPVRWCSYDCILQNPSH